MPRRGKYHVCIDADFVMDPMPVLSYKIGASPRELLVLAHIDHPGQANDDAAGVATCLGVMERLQAKPLPEGAMSVRFVFMPETIGSIAYLSRHMDDKDRRIQAGIFVEMTGSSGPLVRHETQHSARLNAVAASVITPSRPFGSEPANDERVLESVGIPCISVNRGPYPEYHTSDDNMDIIFEDKLQEAADAVERIIRIYATDFVPVKQWKGPLFLSGLGLFSRAAQKIDLCLGQGRSVFEIAKATGLDYEEVSRFVRELERRGLAVRPDEAVGLDGPNGVTRG